jgi:hypothetical protein
MKCERCGQPTEEGTLLVKSAVYWSYKPSFFLSARSAFPAATLGRAVYYPFPLSTPAWRCRSCRWVFVASEGQCSHVREPGFIFPLASLQWWPGPGPFEPSFWYAFTGKSRQGLESEILV